MKALRTAVDSDEEYNDVKSFVSLSNCGESSVIICTQKWPGVSMADTNTSQKSSILGNCIIPDVGKVKTAVNIILLPVY